VLVGTPLLIAALFMLLPHVLPAFLERALPSLRKIIGNTSFIAVKNLIPQVRKSALMILLVSAVIMSAVFGTTFLETIRRGEHDYLTGHFPTEFVLTSPQEHPSTADANKLRQDLLASSAIKHASIVSSNRFSDAFGELLELRIMQGEDLLMNEVVLADLDEMQAQELISAIPATSDLSNERAVVSWRFASLFELAVGDTLRVETLQISDEAIQISEGAWEIPHGVDFYDVADEATFEIVEILREFPGYGPYFWFVADGQGNFFQRNQRYTTVEAVYISGEDEQGILAQLAQIDHNYPDLKLNRYSTAIAASDQTFYQMWSLVIVITLSLLLCSIVGVFNTLMAHINQKRKEYAVLRALSVSEKGIAQIILTQVMLYVLVGLIFGIVLGILMTYLMIIIDPTQVYFNVLFLVLMATILIAATLVVFTIVARKRAKLNPSKELTLEE